MKPKEYISKYNMNGIHSFNHNHFVADLSNDFMATIELLNSKGQLNLKRFEVCVKEIRQKFDSIFLKSSNIKEEEFEKIWKYFYATTIVKVKDDLFGEVIRKQKERKRNYRNQFHGAYYRSFRDFDFGHVEYDFDDMFEQIFNSFFENFFKRFAGANYFTEDQKKSDMSILELQENFTADDVNKNYRKLSLQHHPDKGGSNEMFLKITEAKNRLLSCF